jgi:arylsulfatase A-like enzyme
MDQQLGHLFRELESKNLLENTLVVITSDHGEHFGEHDGIFCHDNSLYSQETRVPLLVIDRRRVPGDKVVSAPVSLRNLPATVVDLAGLEDQITFPGRSLARFWDRSGAGVPTEADPVLCEWDKQDATESSGESAFCRSVSIGNRLYIRNVEGEEELYDVASDPEEQQNLAGSADAHPILEQFRASLQQLVVVDSHRARRRGVHVEVAKRE